MKVIPEQSNTRKVGVLGAGQLGRMLGLAGIPLGLSMRFFENAPSAPAGATGELVSGDYADHTALHNFATGLDVVTYEFENVPLHTAEYVATQVPVYPPARALHVAQDRLIEKDFFRAQGIPTAEFAAVDDRAMLDTAIAQIGFPALLKTRRLGYDGKGQTIIHNSDELDQAWKTVGQVPSLLEQHVSFDWEVSTISIRGRDGDIRHYPLIENHYSEGILRISRTPAPQRTDALEHKATTYAEAVLEELNYVGVLAIEFFVRDNALLANEMAPRVHNSGHWTIEGAETSQFDNHLRAICALPLGETSTIAPSVMVNIIGTIPDVNSILSVPGVHLHLYGKEPRPGRKLGHVTLCGDHQSAIATVTQLLGVETTTGVLA